MDWEAIQREAVEVIEFASYMAGESLRHEADDIRKSVRIIRTRLGNIEAELGADVARTALGVGRRS